MKNGLNISGVSEFVNELKAFPDEAPVIFHVEASHEYNHSSIQIRTIRLGTKRVARGFTLASGKEKANGDVPGSLEYLLIALGTCVMVTYVQGCSAKGITITSLSMKVTADVDNQGDCLKNLKYTVDFDSEGEKKDLAVIAGQVSCFSPNHRTFIEDNTIDVSSGVESSTDNRVAPDFMAKPKINHEGEQQLEIQLDWDYGTQINCRIMNNSRISHNLLWSDQPKQVVGIDLGPNPQEYLFAALSGEILETIVTQLQEHGVTFSGLQVKTEGKLDFRGLMNLDPAIPVKAHNIKVKVIAGELNTGTDFLERVIDLAVRKSIVANTIVHPQEVIVECIQSGENIISFVSNQDHMRGFFQQLTDARIKQDQSETVES